MRAGDLDRPITIEAKATTQAGNGELIESWSTLATVWAQVRELHGRERFQAQQVHAEIDTRFRMRHRTDVTVEHRISYAGSVYDIKAVMEIGRRVGLEILATAVQPEASS